MSSVAALMPEETSAVSPEAISALIPEIEQKHGYERFKRAVDVIVAGAGLVVTSPLLVALLGAVRLDSGSPSTYSPMRVGQGGQFFRQYKLRTMINNAPDLRNPDGSTLSTASDPRVTRLGRVLRKTSLDELPQLVNVLRGEMSLVGPRPDPPSATGLYRSEDFARLAVKPGLTGWAAVQGRNELPWERRRDFDLEYVRERSGWLDLKILMLTLRIVLTGQGVHTKEVNSVPPDTGTDAQRYAGSA